MINGGLWMEGGLWKRGGELGGRERLVVFVWLEGMWKLVRIG